MREKLDYIYYRFYQFLRWIRVNNADINAANQFAFTIVLNVSTIPCFLYAFCGIGIWRDSFFIVLLILLVGLMLIGDLLFLYKSRYLKIIKTYQSESPAETKRGNYQVLIYFVGSLFFLALSVFLVAARNDIMP